MTIFLRERIFSADFAIFSIGGNGFPADFFWGSHSGWLKNRERKNKNLIDIQKNID